MNGTFGNLTQKIAHMTPQAVVQVMLAFILGWLLFFHIPKLTDQLGKIADQLHHVDLHLVQLAERIQSLEEFEKLHHK